MFGKKDKEMTSIRAIIVYAHQDKELLQSLQEHIQPLQTQCLIDDWQTYELRADHMRSSGFREITSEANLILLLISPDFLASIGNDNQEAAEIVARHERGEARVLPLIVRSAFWHSG